jgi:hypothetical protein
MACGDRDAQDGRWALFLLDLIGGGALAAALARGFQSYLFPSEERWLLEKAPQ